MTNISFKTFIEYMEGLADKHSEVNDSYRWNIDEVMENMRSGVSTPLMLIDAVETKTSGDGGKTIRSNMLAFTILDLPDTKTGNNNQFEAENLVLNKCQQICFDMETRIIHDALQPKDSENNQNWLYGRVDKTSFHHFKVGPVFNDRLFGYRTELIIKNQVSMIPVAEKWSDINS